MSSPDPLDLQSLGPPGTHTPALVPSPGHFEVGSQILPRGIPPRYLPPQAGPCLFGPGLRPWPPRGLMPPALYCWAIPTEESKRSIFLEPEFRKATLLLLLLMVSLWLEKSPPSAGPPQLPAPLAAANASQPQSELLVPASLIWLRFIVRLLQAGTRHTLKVGNCMRGETQSQGLGTSKASNSSVGKESTCNAGDPGLIPGSGSSTGEGIGHPLQCS